MQNHLKDLPTGALNGRSLYVNHTKTSSLMFYIYVVVFTVLLVPVAFHEISNKGFKRGGGFVAMQ